MSGHGDIGDDYIDIADVGQGLIGRTRRDDEGAAHMSKNLFEKIAAVVVILDDEHTDTGELIEVVLSGHRWPIDLLRSLAGATPQMY
jgi:hypothetical protein